MIYKRVWFCFYARLYCVFADTVYVILTLDIQIYISPLYYISIMGFISHWYRFRSFLWSLQCELWFPFNPLTVTSFFILTVFYCDFESPCSWTLSNHSTGGDWYVTSPQQHRANRWGIEPIKYHSTGKSQGRNESLVHSFYHNAHFI